MSSKKKNDKKQSKYEGGFKKALELMAVGEEANKAFSTRIKSLPTKLLANLPAKSIGKFMVKGLVKNRK
jgi:hypothetical protein